MLGSKSGHELMYELMYLLVQNTVLKTIRAIKGQVSN